LFQTSKNALFYYLLCFLFNKIGEQEGGTGSSLQWGDGEGGPNNVYTVSKFENNKIKYNKGKS
jgi:hypothetical protein